MYRTASLLDLDLKHAALLFSIFCLAPVPSVAQEFGFDPGFGVPTVNAPVEAAPSAATEVPLKPLPTVEIRSANTPTQAIDLTAPTDDLWVRIRNGFSMPNLNDEVVLYQQQWYMNRPDYLRRMVERSRLYMHFIVEELEKRGMPTELAFLPMVESSFNPMAYSKAHASGLWQFIPATGKRYDLEQNWWHDQRRDVVASTGAALDYLREIYEMNGDWHLALASYNWGENAVKRAVQKNLDKGLPTDFSSLTMPAETRNYVPKLQALKNIFGNPRIVASLGLPELPNRAYFVTLEPGKPMDVAVAAKLAEMPLPQFLALNPAHNRPLINSNVPLVLPADKLALFQTNLENCKTPLATWKFYTLRPGEKIEKIAPRFGIALEELKRVNGLQGRGRVAVGSSLLVPAKDGSGRLDLPTEAHLPQMAPNPPPARSRVAKRHAGKPSKASAAAKSSKAKTAKPARAATAKTKKRG